MNFLELQLIPQMFLDYLCLDEFFSLGCVEPNEVDLECMRQSWPCVCGEVASRPRAYRCSRVLLFSLVLETVHWFCSSALILGRVSDPHVCVLIFLPFLMVYIFPVPNFYLSTFFTYCFILPSITDLFGQLRLL